MTKYELEKEILRLKNEYRISMLCLNEENSRLKQELNLYGGIVLHNADLSQEIPKFAPVINKDYKERYELILDEFSSFFAFVDYNGKGMGFLKEEGVVLRILDCYQDLYKKYSKVCEELGVYKRKVRRNR